MRAIILAGGQGSRLRSIVSHLPKPLAPVQGEPFLFLLIRFLRFYGINDIVISVYHLADSFSTALEQSEFSEISVSLIRESKALGTGGAARFVCEKMKPNDRVLILNGDTFFDFDLSSFVAKHTQHTAIALKKVADTSRYGTVELGNGLVKNFIEKNASGKGGVIYSGIAIVQVGDLLTILPEGPSSLERDFFPKLLADGRDIHGEIFEGKFIDIGTPEDYERANTTFDFGKFCSHKPK